MDISENNLTSFIQSFLEQEKEKIRALLDRETNPAIRAEFLARIDTLDRASQIKVLQGYVTRIAIKEKPHELR